MKRNLYRHARKQGRPLTVTVPTVTPPPPTGTGGQPATPIDVTTGTANSSFIAWSGVTEIYQDDNYLDNMANNRHYGGIGVIPGFLYGVGGTTNAMTAAANPTFNSADGRSGDEWTRARQMKNSNFVARCNARGMEVWLGMYQVNYVENYVLGGEWFDDAAWARFLDLTPTDGEMVYNWAAHASRSGCAGLLFDGENYLSSNLTNSATWEWNYPSNTHTEPQTRAKAKQRGAEMMTCILAGWEAGGNPNPPKMHQYTSEALWRSHRALVFKQPPHNLGPDFGMEFLYHDFWEGMCSVEGYGLITHVDANFHKSPQSGLTFDAAVQYGTNSLQAGMSRWFAPEVWKLACKKIGHNAQFWIDRGQTDFEQVVNPGTANVAMQAFRKYGTNGSWSLYGHHFQDATVNPVEGGPTNYPWSAYWSAFASAASTTSPDNAVPTLTVSVTTSGGVNTISGVATHPEAVRAIEWERRSGPDGSIVADSGAFQMDWEAENILNFTTGYYSNKPMNFGEAVSGGAGAWYVVTATSSLGTATSRVVQAPGAPPPEPPIFEAHLYGATGDGVTDDRAALRAVIVAAAADALTNEAGEAWVHVRAGTYMIGDWIVYESNVTFYGDGADATIIKNMTTKDPAHQLMLRPNGSNITNFVLRDMTFDARADWFVANVGYDVDAICIDLSETIDAFVTNVYLRNCHTQGFYAFGGDATPILRLRILGCHVFQSYGDGISTFGKAVDMAFVSNTVENTQDDAIAIQDAAGVAGQPVGTLIHSNAITHADVQCPVGCTPAGIRVFGAHQTTVSANHTTYTYMSGIVVQEGAVHRSTDTILDGNQVFGAATNNDGVAGTPRQSVMIYLTDGVDISNMTILSNAASASDYWLHGSTDVVGATGTIDTF